MTGFEVTVEIGMRVELHPVMDAWMQGDRFGVVEKIGRKWIHVRMDRSNRLLYVSPARLTKVEMP